MSRVARSCFDIIVTGRQRRLNVLHENSVWQVKISEVLLANFSVGVCLDVCVEWVNVHY